MDELVGIKTRVTLKAGQIIDGWHYAQTRLGLYIAIDPDGNAIRFVPHGKWQDSAYDHESQKARFRPVNLDEVIQTYQTLEKELREPMLRA